MGRKQDTFPDFLGIGAQHAALLTQPARDGDVLGHEVFEDRQVRLHDLIQIHSGQRCGRIRRALGLTLQRPEGIREHSETLRFLCLD